MQSTRSRGTLLVAVLAIVVVAASCGGESPTNDTGPVGAGSTTGSTTTASPEPTATTAMSPVEPAERDVRVFDVAGIEVVVVTETADLPDRATVVEYAGTLIDSGSGPEMCFGGVNDSLPPQCQGVVVDGLEMGAWAEEAAGTRWGTRTVAVSWPPVENHVQLLSDKPFEALDLDYPPGNLPEVCAGIETFVAVGVIHDYIRDLGDRYGGLYLANGGELVLQVTDDPEPHREALATGDAEACVIQTSLTEAELQEIAHDVHMKVFGVVQYGMATGAGSGGRVDVMVPVVDRATVLEIAELVDQPEAVRLIGQAVLLPG